MEFEIKYPSPKKKQDFNKEKEKIKINPTLLNDCFSFVSIFFSSLLLWHHLIKLITLLVEY